MIMQAATLPQLDRLAFLLRILHAFGEPLEEILNCDCLPPSRTVIRIVAEIPETIRHPASKRRHLRILARTHDCRASEPTLDSADVLTWQD